MRILHGFEDPSAYRGGFVAIGNFDGVHRGHQSMIGTLMRNARAAGVPGVVFTFDPHPIAILRAGHTPPSLTTTARKLELLERCGVDCAIVYPTDRQLLDLTPQEFFDRIILEELFAAGLVEGPNFYFGHNRAGNVQVLEEFCRVAGIKLDVVPPVTVGDRLVSSSEVRGLIAGGKVDEAALLLGHQYQIDGVVGRGAERGRTIGFPTANLEHIPTVLPLDGVYAARVAYCGRVYAAGVNVGANPTFAEQQRKIEVHLLDFHGNLYGEPLAVEFLRRLRDTRRFQSVAELTEQLRLDMQKVRELANTASSR